MALADYQRPAARLLLVHPPLQISVRDISATAQLFTRAAVQLK